MITTEHIESARSYAVGAGAMILSAIIPHLTELLQFATAFLGFLIVAHRAWHDFFGDKNKKDPK